MILQRNNKGFTVIEVIVVLAIIVIISAIVAPSLLQASEIATLKSDVQSAKVIANALAFYSESTGKAIVEGVTTDDDRQITFDDALEYLLESEYLKEGSDKPQTKVAEWVYQGNIVWVSITSDVDKYTKYTDLLAEAEKKYVLLHFEAEESEAEE